MLSLGLAWGGPHLAAHAQIAPKDGQIIGRILTFVEHGAAGDADLGIVYLPAVPASAQEARDLAALIGAGLPAGRVVLRARMIPVDEVTRAAGVAGLFVTAGLGPAVDEVARASRQLRAPTISRDLVCVREARCLVGFSTEPAVQIVMSSRSAEESGVSFTPAFRMLVKQF